MAVKTPAKTGPKILDAEQEILPYDGNASWDELRENADEVLGHDLAKDALFDALANVPFLITRLVYRKGVKRNNGVQGAFVSCEAVIAPEAILKKRRVNLDVMPFEPESKIVFNDGSTGIYRQILAYLAATGRVALPTELPESGSYGDTRYDLPPSEWAEIRGGEIGYDEDGFLTWECNVRLSCPRGIRLSEYANDFNPNGSKTRYLA